MKCEGCSKWFTASKTVYSDGTVVTNRESPDGMGECAFLRIETPGGFGCVQFVAGDPPRVALTEKAGAPWQHFVMIPCPSCSGKDGCHGRCKCAGTGLVRLYDDGYVGDEQTRKHPKEVELGVVEPPRCAACASVVDAAWVACPRCGHRLTPVSEVEVIPDDVAMGAAR